MDGRLRIWLVMLPLLGASTEAASLLLDRWAPASYEGAEVFSRSTASRDLLAPVALLGAAALLCALLSLATRAPAGRQLPLRAFACLPAAAFAAQEHVEYAVAHGHVPWALAANPVFLAGLLLQLPFGALAYLAARLLVGVAAAVARRLAAPRLLSRPSSLCARPWAGAPRRPRSLADSRLTRGPPALAA